MALEETVVAVLSEQSITLVADQHPVIWRRMAVVLSNRLRQRTEHVRPRNEVPVVFIGSSRESLVIAEAFRDGLAAKDVIVRLWSEGVFGASRFPIDDLER